jgi:hypothetical protein
MVNIRATLDVKHHANRQRLLYPTQSRLAISSSSSQNSNNHYGTVIFNTHAAQSKKWDLAF